jgi:hypothetical protein
MFWGVALFILERGFILGCNFLLGVALFGRGSFYL